MTLSFNQRLIDLIRKHEISLVIKYLPKNCKILDVGAGNGIQARYLENLGYNVSAIDLYSSQYKPERVFPVIDYDGKKIPFPDNSFDVILSSSVLEHIKELDSFSIEMSRVLKVDGFFIHFVPSAKWRFWTSIIFYLRIIPVLKRLIRHYSIIPERHGEKGNSISELYFFSKYYWRRYFNNQGYKLIKYSGNKIFYTGYLQFKSILKVPIRKKLSYIFGSTVHIFMLKNNK